MLKILINLTVAIVITFWIGMISIFSIQNITIVSLKFLLWNSIEVPVGVLLSFCVGGGLIIGSLFPLLSKQNRRKRLRT